jgi:hypothetical protein
MASKSLPKIRRWSNLHRACQAPLDCLRPIGEVCQLAWSSPGFLRPAQHDIPDKSRFLVMPRLLTRIDPLPADRAQTFFPSVCLEAERLGSV